MHKAWQVVAAMAVVIVVANTGARAACEPFTAFSSGDSRELNYVDVDGDGTISLGDKRLGRRLLTNADGEQIGVLYLTVTVRKVDAEGGPAGHSVEYVYVDGDGVLFATRDSSVAYSGFAVTERRGPLTGTRVWTVVGGMDAYAGARGTTEDEPDGLDSTFTFKLACE